MQAHASINKQLKIFQNGYETYKKYHYYIHIIIYADKNKYANVNKIKKFILQYITQITIESAKKIWIIKTFYNYGKLNETKTNEIKHFIFTCQDKNGKQTNLVFKLKGLTGCL